VKVAVIVNAGAGPLRRRRSPGELDGYVRARLLGLGAEPVVYVTREPGHGRDLARRAVDEGADVVCAWGGDGTVNEVASGLVLGRGVLAVVPVGSGNGFARDLGIPLDIDAALAVAVQGDTRVVDAGDVNGRPFFNVSGLGFDAHVAHVVATRPRSRRGVSLYIIAAVREFFSYPGVSCRVRVDGAVSPPVPILMVALANSRQWGNNIRIAPRARLDDGRLDLVVVEHRPAWSVLARGWRLWAGTCDRASGIVTRTFVEAWIGAEREMPLHIDGEPAGRTREVRVRVVPRALAVKVPVGKSPVA
jgi:YegS/Rv2252/BmrU family lipid kinase